MTLGKFMKKIEREADCTTRYGKTWFSAKTVFEIIEQAKNKQEIEKKLRFLQYVPEDIKQKKTNWTKNYRASGLLEHVCNHGVGHPDYQSAKAIAKRYKHTIKTWLTHGCDGCCGQKDFPGRKKKVKK